jgi:hypothetical protein
MSDAGTSPDRVLLVTLAIGDKYVEEYNRLFRKSQEQYAAKHGYDFKVVSEYLDETRTYKDAISFNKVLVFSQPWSVLYDYIVFVDADILINPDAPAIHTLCKGSDRVGIVDEYSQPTKERRLQIQTWMGWEKTAKEYYRLCGFDIDTAHVLNTGVIVAQPRLHGQLLRDIYEKHVDGSKGHPRGFHYEQSAIGYELLVRNAAHILPNRWNTVWGMYKIASSMTKSAIGLDIFYRANYFIHFAGKVDLDKVESLWAGVSHCVT